MEKQYFLSEEFFGGLMIDTKNNENFSIDKETLDILKFLDEKEDLDIFLKKNKSKITLEDFCCIIQELKSLNIFDLNVKIKDNKKTYKNHLQSPLRIFYDITYGCNLSCKHCFTESGTQHKDELTLEEKYALVEQLKEINVGRISIAGVEP